ncbi:hypothetical protein NQD34_007325 [Periophthalmus magnuspinnatus]|nr:hypothetical protein NQD34_007325 [Periophthalmus magnuspinnatus]
MCIQEGYLANHLSVKVCGLKQTQGVQIWVFATNTHAQTTFILENVGEVSCLRTQQQIPLEPLRHLVFPVVSHPSANQTQSCLASEIRQYQALTNPKATLFILILMWSSVCTKPHDFNDRGLAVDLSIKTTQADH